MSATKNTNQPQRTPITNQQIPTRDVYARPPRNEQPSTLRIVMESYNPEIPKRK